jgi:hypothetical protein
MQSVGSQPLLSHRLKLVQWLPCTDQKEDHGRSKTNVNYGDMSFTQQIQTGRLRPALRDAHQSSVS